MRLADEFTLSQGSKQVSDAVSGGSSSVSSSDSDIDELNAEDRCCEWYTDEQPKSEMEEQPLKDSSTTAVVFLSLTKIV